MVLVCRVAVVFSTMLEAELIDGPEEKAWWARLCIIAKVQDDSPVVVMQVAAGLRFEMQSCPTAAPQASLQPLPSD